GKVTPLDSFSTAFVFRGFEDREGSLWLGTKEGLLRATPTVIATHRNGSGSAGNIIEPVLEDRTGGIWYGSRRGLFHWSNGRLENFYSAADALRPEDAREPQDYRNIVSALYQDRDGTIWAGTWVGAAHLSGGVLVSDGP